MSDIEEYLLSSLYFIVDCTSDNIPGQQFIYKTFALAVEQVSTFSPGTLGDKDGRTFQCSGVKLYELYIRETATRPKYGQNAIAC